jgi:hypothetical protein
MHDGVLANAYISGSASPAYPLSSSYVKRIFNSEISDNSNSFTTGSITSFPTYSIQETGNYSIVASLPLTFEVPTNPTNDAIWSLQVYKKSGSVETLIDQSILTFNAGNPPTTTLSFNNYSDGEFYFSLTNSLPLTDLIISNARVYGYTGTTCFGKESEADDFLLSTSPAIIVAGYYSTIQMGGGGEWDFITRYQANDLITVNGNSYSDGDTFTVDGTVVTVSINTNCRYYNQ